MPLDRRRSGDHAEALALAELTRLGFTVCFPWGNCGGYDLVVGGPHGWHTVQVKSAHREKRQNNKAVLDPRRNSGRNNAGAQRSYSPGQFDFLLAVLTDENRFWLLPGEEVIGRRSVTLEEKHEGIGRGYVRAKILRGGTEGA